MNTYTPATYEHYEYHENGTCASFLRCLQLIEKHAPRLMLSGGGGLPEEHRSHRPYAKVSDDVRQKIIEDYVAKPVPLMEMATRYGVSDTFVGTLLNNNGVKVVRHAPANKYPTNCTEKKEAKP